MQSDLRNPYTLNPPYAATPYGHCVKRFAPSTVRCRTLTRALALLKFGGRQSTLCFTSTFVTGLNAMRAAPVRGLTTTAATGAPADEWFTFYLAQNFKQPRTSRMQRSTLTSRERLERKGQKTSSSGGQKKHQIDNLIVIGASRGGHRALATIFKELSADMPAAIVIVLHMPRESLPLFKQTLGRYCRLPIKEVIDQERLEQGFIFVPPPGKSAEFSKGMIQVKHDIPRIRLRTINHMFKSAAQSYRERVIGVILTGMWRDGTEGLKAVHDAGGVTMVQNPREAEYGDMPANAMEKLPVTFCLKLAEIGPALELLVRRSAEFETGLAVAIRMLRDRVALMVRMNAQSRRNRGTQAFLKNELVSLRYDLHAIEGLVAKAVRIPMLPPSTRQGKRERAVTPARNRLTETTPNVRPDPLNHMVTHGSRVMAAAEMDMLTARTNEMVESSAELARQARVSVREMKDTRRRSRALIRKLRKDHANPPRIR